jgi:sulfite exporter TauE/SafE
MHSSPNGYVWSAPATPRRSNGEKIRVQVTALPNGGRLLTYTLVTDIVRMPTNWKCCAARWNGKPELSGKIAAVLLRRRIFIHG